MKKIKPNYMRTLTAVILVFGVVSLQAAFGATMKPQIKIASDKVSPDTVQVTVTVKNFKLINDLGGNYVNGEGHIHYFLDVQPPTAQGQPAIPPKGSVWAATPDKTYTFDNVKPGRHTVYVELVNNNHTPLNPPEIAKITVKVPAGTQSQGQQQSMMMNTQNQSGGY